MLSDNGNEFKGHFTQTIDALKARQTRIHAGRPQTNGNVEALHKTILDECWRPAFVRYLYPRYTGLKRELDTYLSFYNNDRVHHGRLNRDASPQTSSTVPKRWRQDEQHLSAHPGGRPP
jgi:transposase InsO family protein